MAQKHLALQEALEVALIFLNPPHNGPIFRLIFRPPNEGICGNRGSRLRTRHLDNYIIGVKILVIYGFNFDPNFNLIHAYFREDRQYLEWQVDVLCDTIRHELEWTIRRDESNTSLFIEFR